MKNTTFLIGFTHRANLCA